MNEKVDEVEDMGIVKKMMRPRGIRKSGLL